MTKFFPWAVVLPLGDLPQAVLSNSLHNHLNSILNNVTICVACLSCGQLLTWLLLETKSLDCPLSLRTLSVWPGWDGWHRVIRSMKNQWSLHLCKTYIKFSGIFILLGTQDQFLYLCGTDSSNSKKAHQNGLCLSLKPFMKSPFLKAYS